MEMGAFGIDVAMYGYPNGASYAYLIYLLGFFAAYKFRLNKTSLAEVINIPDNQISINSKLIKRKFKLSIIVQVFFLLILLFGFGGINVLLGNIGKGEFRSNFGFFGAIPFYITKLFSPVLVTYLSIYYVKYKSKIPGLGKLLLINAIICFSIGASWGFKSTAVMLLLPATIVLWPNVSLKKVTIIGGLSLIIFTSFSVLFDNRDFKFNDVKSTITDFSIEETFDIHNLNAFSAIIYRMTVVQGNSAWRLWDLYEKGYPMPNYWKTFLSIFGDKALAWGGITKDDTQAFIDTHYSAATTDLMKKSKNDETFQHNVTATAFSDGVIMGGIFGALCIGFLAGFITRRIKGKIIKYIYSSNIIALSITLVFFTSYFRSWLNSGGFSSLLNISLFVGIGATFLFLRFFEVITKIKK